MVQAPIQGAAFSISTTLQAADALTIPALTYTYRFTAVSKDGLLTAPMPEIPDQHITFTKADQDRQRLCKTTAVDLQSVFKHNTTGVYHYRVEQKAVMAAENHCMHKQDPTIYQMKVYVGNVPEGGVRPQWISIQKKGQISDADIRYDQMVFDNCVCSTKKFKIFNLKRKCKNKEADK